VAFVCVAAGCGGVYRRCTAILIIVDVRFTFKRYRAASPSAAGPAAEDGGVAAARCRAYAQARRRSALPYATHRASTATTMRAAAALALLHWRCGALSADGQHPAHRTLVKARRLLFYRVLRLGRFFGLLAAARRCSPLRWRSSAGQLRRMGMREANR